MGGRSGRDKSGLRLESTNFPEGAVSAAYAVLTNRVFGIAPRADWRITALVDGSGTCAGGVAYRLTSLVLDGRLGTAAALGLVAVDEPWRGLGLMRDLMGHALRWCDERAPLALLYAEVPGLYTSHGFRPLPQHAFVGVAPAPEGEPSGRRLDPRADTSLIARTVAARTPPSLHCSILDVGGDYAARLAADEDRHAVYSDRLGALIVYERDGDAVTLVDVVAEAMPTAARILGALGCRPGELRTLFPPDRLDWTGTPVPDDTGLMARGPLPPAMRRPFMLPPTAEF